MDYNQEFSASEISSFLAYQVSISFHFSPNFPRLELLFGLDKTESNFKAYAIVDGNVSHEVKLPELVDALPCAISNILRKVFHLYKL